MSGSRGSPDLAPLPRRIEQPVTDHADDFRSYSPVDEFWIETVGKEDAIGENICVIGRIAQKLLGSFAGQAVPETDAEFFEDCSHP